MIVWDCPYDGCDGLEFVEIAPLPLPRAEKRTCPACGRWSWLIHSRLYPRSYLPDDVVVDEATKRVVSLPV